MIKILKSFYAIYILILLQTSFVHYYLIFSVRGLLSCSKCHKEFYHLDSLKKHIANLHGNLKGPFSCTTCGRTMKNKNSLYAHIYNYHKRWAVRIFVFILHGNLLDRNFTLYL